MVIIQFWISAMHWRHTTLTQIPPQELAEDLDMLYMPAANMDLLYINPYGYNMRQLDPQLPESCKSFDENDFVRNPSHPNAPKLQFDMFKLKLGQYIDALAHVLNTGESVLFNWLTIDPLLHLPLALVSFGIKLKGSLKQ